MSANPHSPGTVRRMAAHSVLIVGVALLLVAFRLTQPLGPEGRADNRYRVADVVDGDTFILSGGDRVRLLGIDTPEEGEPLHDEATAFLERLVLGHRVHLSFAGRRRDHYGRLLVFVTVDDTLFVNGRMLREGLGYLYLYDEDLGARPEHNVMLAAQRAALNDRRGLFGLVREPEACYLSAAHSHRFHRPWCSRISRTSAEKRRRFVDRDSALWIGLSPCRDCRP